jgi:hypothetical protein
MVLDYPVVTNSTTASEACKTISCYLFTPLPHTEHIFSYPGAIATHIKAFCLFTTLFFSLYFVMFSLLQKVWKPDFFTSHNNNEKTQWKMSIMLVSCIHHFFIVLTAIYCIFIMPPQTPSMRLLWSPTAANLDYYPVTSMGGVFTISYMIFDFTTQVFWLKDFSPLGKQHIIHHTLAISMVVMSLLSGEHFPKMVMVALLSEFSAIFMFIREIKGKTSWKGIYNTINTSLFCLTFTLTRVILFPFMIYSHSKLVQMYDFGNHSLFHKASYWIIFVFFIMLYILNLFWY